MCLSQDKHYLFVGGDEKHINVFYVQNWALLCKLDAQGMNYCFKLSVTQDNDFVVY
jgi:hypothetical protein